MSKYSLHDLHEGACTSQLGSLYLQNTRACEKQWQFKANLKLKNTGSQAGQICKICYNFSQQVEAQHKTFVEII